MARALLLRLVLLSFVLGAAPALAKSVLVWGDSLSAGYGLRPAEAWPVLLQQRLDAARLPYQVVNASISGETSAGGRSRLPAALQTHKPSIVILELGANDGLRGLPTKALAANLQAMSEAATRAGARVLLIGMRMPPNYGPAYTTAFENVFREVARANQARLVPFMMEGFAEQRDYFQADGVHPTAAAQPLIAERIWNELKPLLR